jgi:hypothetical protein
VPTVRPAECGATVRKKEGQEIFVDFLQIDIVVSHPGVKTGDFFDLSPYILLSPAFGGIFNLNKERGSP